MSTTSSRAINPETIESLRELQAPGEPDLLDELFTLYFRDAPARIAELSRFIAAQDVIATSRVAHSLKSASANLGCERMAGYCAKLEALGRTGSLNGAAEVQASIQREYAQIEREAAAFLPRLARTGS